MQFTTLVPAFKPQYLEALLAALQAQTLKPARVVISDDSPDAAFVERLSAPDMATMRQALGLEPLACVSRDGVVTGFDPAPTV